MIPTTISISLPEEQVALLDALSNDLKHYLSRKNADVWITIEEAANRLKVSESLIRKWMADYQLPYSKLGEVRRLNPEKLDKWFEKFCSDDFREGMKIISQKETKKHNAIKLD